VPKARKESDLTLVFPDGYLLRMRVWEVPEPVPPSEHGFKYSLFYGRPGERVILYDNERGKGDHRHYGDHEEAYEFTDVETPRSNFLADVQRVRSRR
jgi:hypothetical protein